MKMKIFRYQRGFTLLELMVVVAIIGILSAVGVVAFTTIQQSGRDTRRLEDMKAYQNAQEQYFTINGAYDSATDCTVGVGSGDNIIAVALSDPKSTQTYSCNPDGVTYGYYACADVEDDAKANGTGGSCDGTTCTITTGTNDSYCVANLQ